MGRKAKCKKCGCEICSGERKVYSGKSYCAACYKIIKDDLNSYRVLITYICENYNISKPTGMMLKQIKEYKNELGYTYNGMGYALWYANEILNKTFDIKYGVSLIKHYYDEAADYYNQLQNIRNSVNNVIDKTKVRNIKITKRSNNNNHLLDIDKLAGDKL